MPIQETSADSLALGKLAYAQKVANDLFEAVEKNKLIVPGKFESQLNLEIEKLAKAKFGIEQYWHKKIVRCGHNTTSIYNDNPSDRVMQADDIVFIDYGIVVDGWESDFARTFVIGNDPRKIKLKTDVEKAWGETRDWIHAQRNLSAADLFQFTRKKAKAYGWTSAGEIAGHIVGKFPHEQPEDPKSLELDIHPDNTNDIFLRDHNGNKRHWILEIHFIDEANRIGGYIEQLL
jgi:Xaa-Pro aminopeptidase